MGERAMMENGIGDIRADLTRRIAAIEWRGGPAGIAVQVDAIRSIANAHAMHPAVVVAQQLETALSRGERGPLVHGWLAILRDAVTCERQDLAARETFAAACAVRLAR